MKPDTMEKDFKLLFGKIGNVKAPEDFTNVVMKKIKAENQYARAHALQKSSYWSLLPYLIAMILVIPFVIPTINWIINIDWSFISFDISMIREWIERLADNFAAVTFTSQAIIISLIFVVMLAILAIEISGINQKKIFG